MKKATLIFPVRGTGAFMEVFLGIKTKKIGAGLWNGWGGKEEDSDVSIRHAAVREFRQESGGMDTDVESLIPRALIDFFFPGNETDGCDWSVAIYTVNDIRGTASDTEEMTGGRWFRVDDIPYDEMLPADRDFLPKVFSISSTFYGKIWFADGMKGIKKSHYEDKKMRYLGI